MKPKDIKVEEISSIQAKSFIAVYHYLGDTNGDYYYGGFYEDSLVGVVTFKETPKKGIIMLERLTMKPECPRNSESHFIKLAIIALKQKIKIEGITTCVDRTIHTGAVYKASGFRELDTICQTNNKYFYKEIKC